MKFKFDDEVQLVINAIAALPAEADNDVDLWKPNKFIGDFEKDISYKRDAKTMPMKQYVKLRRQLSFLYGLVKLATDAEVVGRAATQTLSNMTNMKVFQMPASEDLNELIKRRQYGFLVKLIKEIHNGEALKDKYRVRMALNYGVLQLSDHEIDGLIERNKV